MATELLLRASRHDLSKLQSPEAEFFAVYTPLLDGVTFGDPQYKEFLAALKPALDHHYGRNDHHPEHYREGTPDPEMLSDISALERSTDIPQAVKERLVARLQEEAANDVSPINEMNLPAILEMTLDWKASSERHRNGNILRSILINTPRFRISRQLAQVLVNTVKFLEGK